MGFAKWGVVVSFEHFFQDVHLFLQNAVYVIDFTVLYLVFTEDNNNCFKILML